MQVVSPLSVQAANAKPWYTHRWPWLLMLGPFLVILAGTYTGWLAFTRQDAMVVDDYYRQGKAINRDLRRDRVATGLGLSFNARYDPASGKLDGSLLGFGQPVAGKIGIHLAHPTQPEKDLQMAAQVDQRGEFSIALPMLERSRWQVSIESGRRDWRLSGVWQWPQQQTIVIGADVPSAN